MEIKEIKELESLINGISKAVVIPHKNPDGDALGSCLAWQNVLNQKGVNTKVIAPTNYPDFLKWLPENDTVLVLEDDNEQEVERLIQETDAVFCLDFNDLSRIDEMGHFVNESKAKKVMIDHHLFPKDFADITISYSDQCSTCQLVFLLIEQLGWKGLLNKEIGAQLYTGIVTDTGSFKYRSTDSDTHRIASEVKLLGVDTEKIHRDLFDNSKENRLRLLGHLLLNNMVVNLEKKVAYFSLTVEEMEQFNYQKGDHEGVVNYALSIQGVEVAAFFRAEGEKEVRISFRSKGSIPVNELAQKYFNGGGHQNAAGGVWREGMKSCLEMFERSVDEIFVS